MVPTKKINALVAVLVIAFFLHGFQALQGLPKHLESSVEHAGDGTGALSRTTTMRQVNADLWLSEAPVRKDENATSEASATTEAHSMAPHTAVAIENTSMALAFNETKQSRNAHSRSSVPLKVHANHSRHGDEFVGHLNAVACQECIDKDSITAPALDLVESSGNSNSAVPVPLSEEPTTPVLVILVGPPKTATSTLQRHLSEPRTQADLQKDNYTYEGRRKGAGQPERTPLLRTLQDRSCKEKTEEARKNKQAMPECWNRFTNELDRLHQTGQNVILVEEALSDACFDLPAFQQATTKWQVLIVVTYRQFWSWLPSFKNQFEKLERSFSSEPKSTDPLPWLLDRRRPSSSPEFFKAMISVKNRKEIRVANILSGEYLPYTDNVVDLYRDLGDQVRIMDMHLENTKVTSNFLCEILPNAPNTCQTSLHQTKQQSSNPSIPMDYQLIAVDAVDRGLLDQSKFNRTQVVRILRQHHQKKLESRPLPLECMDQVSLEAFLAESMRLEREVVPDFYADHEEQHRKSFWNAAAKNKFCSVNTTAVLIDPDWLSIFAQLENE
jgi:hypothetical protein